MKAIKKPRSVIDKWIHFDRGFKHADVAHAIGVELGWYSVALERPWDHFTPSMMQKMSILLDRPLPEVFWACWMKPESDIKEDRRLLDALAVLNKAGVR